MSSYTKSSGIASQSAVRFLRSLRSKGPWTLASIVPDGRITVRSFAADSASEMTQWVAARNGKENLYFIANPAKTLMSVKPKEADIARDEFKHVDCDPRDGETPEQANRRITAELEAHDPPPTMHWSSGNGRQALWRLDTPIPLNTAADIANCKAINQAIAERLGADNCQSIEHLLRLPFTMNLPNKRKLAKGRKPIMAGELVCNNDRAYADWELPQASPSIAPSDVPAIGEAEPIDGLADLSLSDHVLRLVESGNADGKYPSRSESDFAATIGMLRDGATPGQVLFVLTDGAWPVGERIRERDDPDDYARKEIARAQKKLAADVSGDFGAVPEEEDVSWMGGPDAEVAREFDVTKLPEMLDYMEAQLKGKAPLYQIGGRIVHPVRLDKNTNEDDVRRNAGALVIRDVSALRLREYAIEHVKFCKRSKNGRVRFPAPMMLANHYLAREDKWTIPALRGVIEAPTLRSDGSVIETEGYDAESGLLLDFKGTKFPPISEEPTEREIADALDLIKTPFKAFPFVDGPSRAVMLSAALTALIRRTLFSAPMHGFSAPLMGTGKTLACNCVSLISVGRLATAMSQGASEEEDEKRFFSVLLQNDLITLIDNVKRSIAGDALCTILTEPTWQSRILGENRKVIVPTNSLWLASGNNLTFAGDMTTRALLCRMDAQVERPETRRFDVDLKEWIPQHRPELVAAGLTMLRGYVAAGRPGLKLLVPFGRFEQWSDLVRGALVWVGEDDPCKTRAYIAVDDPERATLAELLRAMHVADEGRHHSTGEWITAAESDWEGPLRRAIEEVTPGLDKKAFGRYLKANQGRIVSGLRLWERYDSHVKVWTYRVVEI